MFFRLPPQGSAAREAMGDLAHVVEVLNPANLEKLQPFRSALINARRDAQAFGAKAVNIICICADDERWLIAVGPRGEWRRVCNFGNGRL